MENENPQFMKSIHLLRSFADVQKMMLRFVQKSASENGLSIPQYTILMTVILENDMTQKNVGEKTFLPKSTLSQAVDGLVREGLLNRQQVEGNRREVLLSLNDKGLERIKAIHAQEGGIHQIFQGAVETMTDKQYDDVLRTHLHIKNHMASVELEEQLK